MKKFWILTLAAMMAVVAVGCAKDDAPPPTNPTGEKSADDKSAAGGSGVTAGADAVASEGKKDEPKGSPVDTPTKPSEQDERILNVAPGQKVPEKPADDSGKAVSPKTETTKNLPPPGTPLPADDKTGK